MVFIQEIVPGGDCQKVGEVTEEHHGRVVLLTTSVCPRLFTKYEAEYETFKVQEVKTPQQQMMKTAAESIAHRTVVTSVTAVWSQMVVHAAERMAAKANC